MRGNFERYGKRSVAKDFDPVVFRNETGFDQRFHIDALQGILGCQLFQNTEVNPFVFHSFQVRKTVFGQASLQRHLASFET